MHADYHSFFVNHWKRNDNDFLLGRHSFRQQILSWNRNIFGNLEKQKRRIFKRLDGIQKSLSIRFSSLFSFIEIDLLNELNHIHKVERTISAQKAGIDWHRYSDFNTKYFHIIAKTKKFRGKIQALVDNLGALISDQSILKHMGRNFFPDLFSTSLIQSSLFSVSNSPSLLTFEDSLALQKLPSIDEVRATLFAMAPLKCPGPNGLHLIFFKEHWEDLHPFIFSFVTNCFVASSIRFSINHSYLSLIPKKRFLKVLKISYL